MGKVGSNGVAAAAAAAAAAGCPCAVELPQSAA